MKLRNKRTGEMGIINYFDNQSIVIYPIDENWDAKGDKKYVYHSLAELNAEWCDVPEEPKEYWYISDFGYVFNHEINNKSVKSTIEEMKSIGNYFLSREEAKRAVEKLKAFKRLKDKGFRFDLSPALGHCDDKKFDISIIGTMPAKWWYNDKVVDDIHYIFGGEE